MTKKLYASDPSYHTYNELWNLYSIAKNPQIWMHEYDLESWEKIELLETLEGHMQDLLDGLEVIFLDAEKNINLDNLDI
jgi:hypothetical protein